MQQSFSYIFQNTFSHLKRIEHFRSLSSPRRCRDALAICPARLLSAIPFFRLPQKNVCMLLCAVSYRLLRRRKDSRNGTRSGDAHLTRPPISVGKSNGSAGVVCSSFSWGPTQHDVLFLFFTSSPSSQSMFIAICSGSQLMTQCDAAGCRR